MVRTQPLQTALNGADDVVIGKIKLTGADAALGLDGHFLPEAGVVPENVAEKLLTAAVAAVDVRVLKEADARVQIGADQRVQLPAVQPVDAHTALGDPGNGNAADGLIGHKNTLSFF